MISFIRNLERASRLLWKAGRDIGALERGFYEKLVLPRLAAVPALPAPALEIDVVSLVCAKAADMAIWMARSLNYFSGREWRQVWIDDGSITPEIAARARRALPRLRIISHAEASERLAKTLCRYPACRRAAADHPIFRRVFLLSEVVESDRFVSVDSDVLFFADPREMIAWAGAPSPSARFMHDPITFYFPRLEELSEWAGRPVTPHVNGGLNLLPKEWHDIELTERFLAEYWDNPHKTWHIEQSIIALQMTRLGAEPLSIEYELSFHPRRRMYCVARHYVGDGPVRDYFFTEGVALLSQFLLDPQAASLTPSGRSVASPVAAASA